MLKKIKDEEKGKIITEFVGLRSKLYSLTVHGKKDENKVCKGCKTCVIRKELTFNDYKSTLVNKKQVERK